jgi:iron-sulfur cluster repair protein YtfE (RIC family)
MSPAMTAETNASQGVDLSVMTASHAAFRRDLIQLARAAEPRSAAEPARALAVANGWETFKRQLHNHHTMEDEVIWPALRERLAGRGDALSVLDEMEHEHGFIDPILAAADKAFAEGDTGSNLAGVIAELATTLGSHLEHEERDALPLIGAAITAQEWGGLQGAMMARPEGAKIGPEMFPWLLEGASEEETARLLAPLPPFVLSKYLAEWKPAYDAVARWQ